MGYVTSANLSTMANVCMDVSDSIYHYTMQLRSADRMLGVIRSAMWMFVYLCLPISAHDIYIIESLVAYSDSEPQPPHQPLLHRNYGVSFHNL